MKRAIILHGTQGSPDGNWFHWLETELKERGYKVWLPSLPHPEQPSLAEWAAFVTKNCPFSIDEDTLLVGHSSGAILALIVTQQNLTPVGGLIAVSVFHDNSLGWDANDRFFDTPFDYAAIRRKAQKKLFVHSDNDPYVPLNQAEFVAENCHAEIVVINGQKHFNIEADKAYESFPKLLKLLDERHIV